MVKLGLLLQKLVSFLAALTLISMLTFVLAKVTSSNPAENYLRISKIGITPETLAQARTYLGLDKSWLEQYGLWLSQAIRGDFGTSYLFRVPVLPLILSGFRATFYLGSLAFAMIIVVAFPLGILSGIYKNSYFDKVVQLMAFSSVSIPSFWLGYMLMIVFAVQLKWLPVSGQDGFASMILPALTLSFSLIGQYTSLIRKVVIEEMRSVHVENAQLRGVTMVYIVKNHLLPNILPALATGLSLTSVYLLTGALIVEEVFSWNGLGRIFVRSLQAVDMPVIQASMLLFGSLFLVNNVASRFITTWIDPRLRYKARRQNA